MNLKYICDNKRHLICEPYSIENLHKMAEELGLKRHWYHPGRFPHYDIPVRRQTEIMEQCEVIDQRKLLGIIKSSK